MKTQPQRSYTVAVIGAGSLVGRELVDVLRERQFPLERCRLLDTFEALADAEFDENAEVESVDEANLGGVDLAFLCGSPALSQAWAPRAIEVGAQVVDLTQAFADRDDVPLVVPEVNPKAAGAFGGSIVASPCAGAVALSVVLSPVLVAGGLRRVVVAGYEPVSSAGQHGIHELSQQTAGLMNGMDIEATVFPHRIAFNVIPHVGEFLPSGVSRTEWEIESQTRRVLGQPNLPISVTSVRVPTFFGQGYALNVETEVELAADEARALLREAPGILLIDDLAASAYPTLIDALAQEATYVGRVRNDPSVAYGLNLWVTIDGIRKGAAVNAVQIAELTLRNLAIE